VDDHALFREGLARLLEAEADLKVIGRCGSLQEALQILERHEADVVLLDYRLQHEEGTALLHRLRKSGFKGKVLMVTAGVADAELRELVPMGISGVFLKHDPPSSLIHSIREVMGGRTSFAPEHVRALAEPEADPPDKRILTERQRSVLGGVLEGLSNKEIASRLGTSETAVKAVLQLLFTKMEVRTRSQLVRAILEDSRRLI
jgi:two-component system nitrate/nitrite response regulator NarL